MLNSFMTFVHGWKILRRARYIDVVHLNLALTPTLPLLRGIALSIFAKAAGVGLVLHAHTGQLKPCLDDRLYRSIFLLGMHFVDILLVVSKSAENAVRELGIDNVFHSNNGVAVAVGPARKEQAEPLTMALVGTVCRRKGLIDLRDALALIMKRKNVAGMPFDVLIIGSGEQEGPGAFEEIRLAFSRTPHAGSVHFLGALDHAKVLETLNEAAIFCLPSHTEGFPLSLLEAMSCGTAIIATSVGDVPDILDHGRAGILVNPGNVEDLSEAIVQLLTNPGERALLARAARSRVEEIYTFEKMVRRLHNFYLRAAVSKHSRNEPS